MFTTALVTTAQSQYTVLVWVLSVHKWLKKMYAYTTQLYAGIKKKKCNVCKEIDGTGD